MRRRILLSAITAFTLAACDSGAPGTIPIESYEGPEGEAVVRHLIKNLPPLAPEVPKVYAVVKGPHLKSTGMDFAHRMDDLKLTFVSGEVLIVREPDQMIVDPRTNLAPVTLQLDDMKSAGLDKWDVVASWAWKKTFERRRYRLAKTAQGYEVSEGERLGGNFVKSE